MFRSRLLRVTALVMLLVLSASVATAAASVRHRAHRAHRAHHHRIHRHHRVHRHHRRHAKHHPAKVAKRASTAHTSRVRATTRATKPAAAITNPFGRSMFGVAAGGALQNEDATTLGKDLDADAAVGAKWLRIDINWAQIQASGSSSYNWTNIDAVVKGAESRGINVLGVIVYTPSWARPAGTSATYGPAASAYAAFARTAVAHYSAMGVHAYEIWNEENTSAAWTPSPSPSAYAGLLKAAYPVIKAADPSATVVTGGLAPAPTDGTNYTPVDFLKGVYAAGGHGSFDAVGAHPYCWPAMPGSNDSWSAWYQMANSQNSLRTMMVARGDGAKKIWATEFGAPTNGPAGSYVSESTQAAMIYAAYQVWSSYSWAGPLFTYQGRDQGTDTSTRENFFGFIRHDGTAKPGFAAYQKAVAAF
jgi:hypothetical protein